jgi:DNA-binding IclR family transcriptional regulator
VAAAEARCGLAVPVRDGSLTAVAAIAVAGVLDGPRVEQAVRRLTATADEVNRRLTAALEFATEDRADGTAEGGALYRSASA